MTEPAPRPTTTTPHDPRAARPFIWTSTSYFAEGFPYSIVNNIADLFFTELGASLKAIGLTSLFHVPWNLKFLLGPLVDEYATKRKWLVALEVLLTVAIGALAFFSSLDIALKAAPFCFLLLAILSATHDIAIDGFYLEALDKDGQALFVGSRVTAYRRAIRACTGPLVVLAKAYGWTAAFVAMTALMLGLTIIHALFLPRVETERKTTLQLLRDALRVPVLAAMAVVLLVVFALRSFLGSEVWTSMKAVGAETFPKLGEKLGAVSWTDWLVLSLFGGLLLAIATAPWWKKRMAQSKSNYAGAFTAFLEQRYAARILIYIVLFRCGESFLMKMKYPFLKNELGITLDEYGFINGIIGMIAGLAAPMIGGWLIAKHGGLKRFIWPFMLAQNGLHLTFAALALTAPDVAALDHPVKLGVVTLVVVIEVIGAGLGTAAFTVYIMRSCNPAHKAAHMALLTAIMSISFTLAGVLSGFLAEAMGFPLYFAFTFVVTVPGMLLTWFVPRIDTPDAAPRIQSLPTATP
jgi:PAT family beta-lactamase induction signal transducer AmpG